jgi:lipopolysaccharide biosynthesis protein
MKSDFRNYGVFIMQSEKVLGDASRLCFINDSFLIVDVNAYGLCMKQFFNNEMTMCDFGGLTSSYEGTFHLQSYLMCFNGPTIPHVLAYFETNGLPSNHGYAISKYELGITKYLTDKMFSPYAVVSNDDMRIPLNTTCIKWEKVFEKTGIIKRQHFLKQYAYSAMTDDDIARVATNHFYNKHFIHYLNYHGINQKLM